ncbi:hypothetical protein QYM36_008631 [Artemia franciscana]|uniref:DDE Tnp4 domain-containing protein n=1 Tax=Artemia franciscana TaxID=6661 RepID=A0AA88HUH7_ARTSF|nr:hypothetical protein QYM36_008631 [Artemia franciscana]
MTPYLETIYSGDLVLSIPLNEVLYVTLFYMASSSSIRTVAQRFGRSESGITFAINEVCRILEKIQHENIKWPDPTSYPLISAQFHAKSGFPGVIACIGCCQISVVKVKKTNLGRNSWIDYEKGNVDLLAMVLPDKSFCFTYIGFPGSGNGSYVFKNSIWHQNYLVNREIYFPRGTEEYHLIGDHMFPLYENLQVPFKNPDDCKINSQQIIVSRQHIHQQMKQKILYNKKFLKAKFTVEQSFRDLVNRFQRCQSYVIHRRQAVKEQTIKNYARIVTTACVLHNMCIQNGDLFQYQDLSQVALTDTITDWPTMTDSYISHYSVLTQSGTEKRNRIMKILT